MRALVILALFVFVPSLANANKPVGVLVTGQYLKEPTQNQAERWLRERGREVVTSPLPSDAIKILLDCFVLDDAKCSSSVIDSRATTDNVVSIRVELTSKKEKEVRLTIDWFVKGHNAVSARRICESCTETVLRSTLDAMLLDVAKTSPGFMGTIKVVSEPPGMTVLLDNANIGVTPIEHAVASGKHEVRLSRDGRTGEAKTIEIEAGATQEVTLVPPEAGTTGAPRRSRVVPGILIGLGVAGIGAGTALYLTSEEPTGMNRTYRDTKGLGIGVAAGGGALVLTGVIIILATGSSSGPTVAMTPGGGATFGWTGRF